MIAGVLLAAGRGTRFGAHKLLHPLADGTPMVLASMRTLLPEVDRTYVVVRPDDDALIELLSPYDATIVRCENAEDGMGASLSCAVRSAHSACAWIVALADMPFIQATTIRQVSNAMRGGAPLAAPSYKNQRGHPVGFAADYRDALSELKSDVGAKALLTAEHSRLQVIPCNDPGVLHDVDTRRDLQQG